MKISNLDHPSHKEPINVHRHPTNYLNHIRDQGHQVLVLGKLRISVGEGPPPGEHEIRRHSDENVGQIRAQVVVGGIDCILGYSRSIQ